MLLCDDKKINKGGWIGPVAVSPTGVPAYWVFEDSRSLGGCQLYFGKKKTSKWVNGDTDAPPTLLGGGRLAASVAGRGGAWSIVTLSDKGRKERGKLPGVYMLIPARGADEVLYTGIKNLDRPESAPIDFYLQRYSIGEMEPLGRIDAGQRSVGSPVYSSGGDRLAFKVLGHNWMGVSTEGQGEIVPTPWKFVDDLTFSPDGAHLAYAACVIGAVDYPLALYLPLGSGAVLPGVSASSGRWTVVVDDKPRETYEHVRRLSWSPDGSRLAFAALRDGTWRVIVDKQSSAAVDEITKISWESSSQRLRYGCREGREIRWREMELE